MLSRGVWPFACCKGATARAEDTDARCLEALRLREALPFCLQGLVDAEAGCADLLSHVGNCQLDQDKNHEFAGAQHCSTA